LGGGGIARLAEATGLSRTTIAVGLQELEAGETVLPTERSRRSGAGRKRLVARDPGLSRDLAAAVESTTRGDPQSALRWTCKSVRRLAAELQQQGHVVSPRTVATLLDEAGYSLQGNRKTKEGTSHPDRDAQFEYLNARIRDFQRHGQPVISVDTKKKELVGDFKNGGREWRTQGTPVPVRVYDFVDKTLGKAIPYGVYDLAQNTGWVTVGMDHDTPAFAVASIRQWWRTMGATRYPEATELLITADGGGSNGYRPRAWKTELQRFATETGLVVSVSHLPPGTSKWNKIEHRLFCHITQNWRGQPLVSHEVIVQLIGATTTRTGLRVRAKLDRRRYPTGRKVSDDEFQRVNLTRADFHGEWNYTISPERKTS
jgi:hypothetical protein